MRKVEYLRRIEYDFQKYRVTDPWIRFLLKSIKQNVMFVYLLILTMYT
jgi:hypothetical protein